jgi:hypothetical protein
VARRGQVGSLVADAVLRRAQVGSVTADAVARRAFTGSFTADAVIVGKVLETRQNITALGIWRPRPRLVLGRRRLIPPDLLVPPVTPQTGSFTANAVVRRARDFIADAVVRRSQSGSLVADAV